MTIFVEIGKQFLRQELTNARNNSVKADSSVYNSALGLFGFQRDTELSAGKRDCLDNLRQALYDFNTDGSDQIALEQFKTLLTAHRTIIEKQAAAKHLGEGATGSALLNAIAFIQSIYDKFAELNFLNAPKSNHPFSIFLYYTAHYFATKLCYKQNLGLLQGAAEQPQISNFRARAQERERLISEAITSCKTDLEGLNKKHPDYSMAVTRQVNAHIARLKLADGELCKKYGLLLNTTTTLLHWVGVTERDDMLLSTFMDNALSNIQALTTKREAGTEPTEWDDLACALLQGPCDSPTSQETLSTT